RRSECGKDRFEGFGPRPRCGLHCCTQVGAMNRGMLHLARSRVAGPPSPPQGGGEGSDGERFMEIMNLAGPTREPVIFCFLFDPRSYYAPLPARTGGLFDPELTH